MAIFISIVFVILIGIGMMWVQALCYSKMHEQLPETFWFNEYGSKVDMCREDKDNGIER